VRQPLWGPVKVVSELEAKGHPGFAGSVGVAVRDITPDLNVRARCWGPARHDLPSGVHRPLTLTALALSGDAGGPPLVLFTTDLSFFRRGDDEWRVRGAVVSGLGLPVENVVFHLVHTHAGPSLATDEADEPGGDKVAGYLDEIAARAVAAGREAIGGVRPATLEWAVGSCSLAANRDLVENGRALVGYNAAVEADRTVLVGRVTDSQDVVLATIINYACHPTTLAWQNHLLSPDYVGAVREVVEGATGGAPCLFLQGASGELAPRHQYVGDTEVADLHGRELGYAALAALSGMLPACKRLAREGTVESGAPLALWEPTSVSRPTALRAVMSTVELPMQPLPTIDQLAERWSGIDPVSLEERLRRARSLRATYGEATSVRYPVWCWMMGDSFLVAHPGEAYSAFQGVLRQRHGSAVAVLNLSNGPGFFYFPTDGAYATGAYQAWQTLVGRDALPALIETASSLIAQFREAR
jgi:hypothetical protein